ncbi:MAG: DegQ family serine endoprotease [Legionellales bacterium]
MNRLIRLISPLCLLVLSSAVFAQLPDFTHLSKELSPTVVNISSTRNAEAIADQYRFDGAPDEFGDMFEQFFGRPFSPEEFDSESLGSGFIISKDGYILTSNHVIQDSDEIIVRTIDGDEYDAKMVGADPGSDLALLKIEPENELVPVKFGSSTDLQVGEWVVAIGAPFGFDYSVTAGIVSAKGRPLQTEKYVPFIQTDVAINPGNSGGPLFNMRGEVVGINAQIVSRSGGYLGLSFAIPSDVAVDVIEQLKSSGHVTRGWLGVLFQDIDRNLAESFGLKQPRGALVAEVVPDSPASKGGLLPGDIITHFGDKRVEHAADLPHLVGLTKPNEKVDLTVIRESKQKIVTVKITELPAEEELAEVGGTQEGTESNRLGLNVRELTDEERARLDLTDTKRGVLVVQVANNSPASKARLRPGDVILTVNNIPVRNPEDLANIMQDVKDGQAISMLVTRRGEPQRYLAIRPQPKQP